MWAWKLPGVAVAAPTLAGTVAAGWGPPRPLLALALLALGLARGGAGGRAVAIAAAALLSGWLRAPVVEPPAWIDPSRPLAVSGRLIRSWRPTALGWSARLAAETARQGTRVEVWPARLEITLGSPSPPVPLRRLTVRGRLGRAPPLGNDPPTPAGPWRLRVKSARLIDAVETRRGPSGGSRGPRRRLEGLFAAAEPGGGHGLGLARALVLGDSSRLDRDVLHGLRRLGLGHLLAVSGLHVGLAGAIVWWLAAPLPRRWRQTAPLLGAAAYLAVVGPRPAILRAAVMAVLATRALATRRPPQSLNGLAWALTGVLLVDPGAVGDAGFALTAAATAGIVVLGPALERRWRRLPAALGRPLAVSAGAQLGALPWTLSLFHSFTPATAVLNLVAVPWTALTLVASFLWLAAAVGPVPARRLAGGALDLLAAPYAWPGRLPPRLAAVQVSGCGWLGALTVAAGLGALLLARRRFLRLVGLAVALAVLLAPAPRPGAEVVMLDVGQGDAILLRDGRRAALVDGGGWHRRDIAQRVLVPALARLGVRRLDAVVLTHPDLDHCRGLLEVAGYLPVAEVWLATGLGPDGCAGSLRRRAGTRWRPLWRGRRAALGAWRFEVLHPPAASRGGDNDSSLVLRASAGGRAILLTGDIGERGERQLLRHFAPGELRAAVLKVPHHGSAGSTSERFLAAVAPRLALISAGRGNRYGHPSPRVLERLGRRGVAVLRTDRQGMIRLSWPRRIAAPRAGASCSSQRGPQRAVAGASKMRHRPTEGSTGVSNIGRGCPTEASPADRGAYGRAVGAR